jgi:transcriptional regulator with XRE-family HTH domain
MPGKKRNAEGELRQIPTNHIKAWRDFRGLTLERLVELTGLSIATLSDAENRKTDVTGKTLLEIARALRTTPGALLDLHPAKAEPWWDTFADLSDGERDQAVRLIRIMRENH